MTPEPFLYIAGPCVLETVDTALRIAERLAAYTRLLPVRFVFKGSFDKANRTSLDAFRGPGLDEGLAILRRVKEELGVPVLSDVHEPAQAAVAAEVLDILQVPAFLCRQTDLLVAAARTGRPVNIKKGQFVAPADMDHAVDKVRGAGGGAVTLTERGACFGYNNLVVDFRSFSILRGLGCPVIFDATHSVQIPSAGGASGGERQYIEPLARAAAAYGIDGLFTEVYPDPDLARCDGANSLPLEVVPRLLDTVLRVREAAGPPDTLPGGPASLLDR